MAASAPLLEPRCRMLLPEATVTTIVLVGVGGTGSWLAPALARILFHARQKGQAVKLFLVDPDIVSESNIGRQNFALCQVGESKCESLAWRLNSALGLDIAAIPAPFVAADFMPWLYEQQPYRYGLHPRFLLVGAVDNYLARRELAAAQTLTVARYSRPPEGVWVVDCGNGRSSAQILAGNLTDPAKIKVDKLGLCSGLPSPYLQEPGLLEPDPVDASPLSCAELTLREEQSLLINTQVAAVAAQYVYDLIIRCRLDQYATYLNLEPPAMSSLVLTPTNLARFNPPCEV
jgi:PRTRC genetic system ThiF family protein